jgi:uncharacterized membrane protein
MCVWIEAAWCRHYWPTRDAIGDAAVFVADPSCLLAGLIAKDTFTTGQSYAIDARAAGLAVAVLATWRKLPFVVVIVAGVGTTALIRVFV